MQEDRMTRERRCRVYRRRVPRELILVTLPPALELVVGLEVDDKPRAVLFERKVDDALDHETGRRLHRDWNFTTQLTARSGRLRTLEERVRERGSYGFDSSRNLLVRRT